MTGSPPDRSRDGFVFVAFGDAYVREAGEAAGDVRRWHPATPICLITDIEPPEDSVRAVFSDVVLIPEPTRTIRDKLFMFLAPYERCLFLDTDTLVVEDVSDAFTILDRFDIAANQVSSGYHYQLPGVPNSFPEFNTGVIAFRRSAAVQAFFEQWLARFDEHLPQMQREWDQRSFRHAVYESNLRVAVLPPEYNFMSYGLMYAWQPVRIVHGRPRDELRRIAAEMNRRCEMRVYVPRLGCITHYNRMLASDLWRLWVRSLWLVMLEAVKRPLRWATSRLGLR